MKEAKSSLGELEKFHQKLIEFTASKRLSTPTDPFVFTKQNFDTNKIIAQKVLQTGSFIIFFSVVVIISSRDTSF